MVQLAARVVGLLAPVPGLELAPVVELAALAQALLWPVEEVALLELEAVLERARAPESGPVVSSREVPTERLAAKLALVSVLVV